jgi:hypothetical protein
MCQVMERFPHNAVVFKVFVELEARYGLAHRVRTHWESMWQGPMRIAQVYVECVLYRMCARMRQMLVNVPGPDAHCAGTSVKRDLIQCQKRPSTVCQKRTNTASPYAHCAGTCRMCSL